MGFSVASSAMVTNARIASTETRPRRKVPGSSYAELTNLFVMKSVDTTILTNDSPSHNRKSDETMVIVLRAGHMHHIDRYNHSRPVNRWQFRHH